MPREPQSQTRMRVGGFAIGDTVRLRSGEFAGYVGTIRGTADPDSPWKWLVYGHGDQGPGHVWGTAVNDDELELPDAA